MEGKVNYYSESIRLSAINSRNFDVNSLEKNRERDHEALRKSLYKEGRQTTKSSYGGSSLYDAKKQTQGNWTTTYQAKVHQKSDSFFNDNGMERKTRMNQFHDEVGNMFNKNEKHFFIKSKLRTSLNF